MIHYKTFEQIPFKHEFITKNIVEVLHRTYLLNIIIIKQILKKQLFTSIKNLTDKRLFFKDGTNCIYFTFSFSYL